MRDIKNLLNWRKIMSIKRIAEKEKEYVLDVLESQFRTSSGAKYMKLLEEEFASKINCDHAVSFINGTATMHACLEAWGIGVGDEVIVTPLTMSSTTFAVLQANATPVYADVDKNTFNIDANSIKEKITSKTKAIISVSLYGQSPDYDEILEIINDRNIKLLEDNAECFLGMYKGRTVGSIGDASSFSFQSSKHLSSGEGGIVTTNDEDFAVRLRKIQSLGYLGVGKAAKIKKSDIQDPSYNRHGSLGWNYRMPELCAAVAYAQTQRMEELVNARVESAKLFSDATKDHKIHITEQYVPEGYINSYWTWVAKIEHKDLWHPFKNLFIKNGGDSFYSAWQLSYLEPFIQENSLLKRDSFISKYHLQEYKNNPCPVAEDLQPRLMQFKTNYWNVEEAKKQAEILNKTCNEFFGS